MKDNLFYKYQSPRGFNFFSTEFSTKLGKLSSKVDGLLQEHGCTKIIPPTVDYVETFRPNTSKDVFSFRDHDNVHLALRNDVTLQIIKGISSQLDLIENKKKEYRFCYQLPVFQNHKSSNFRAREIYQVGMEVLQYQDSFEITCELLKLGHQILKEILGVEPIFCISTVETFHVLRKLLIDSSYSHLDQIVFSRSIPELALLFKNIHLEKSSALKLSRLLLFDYMDDAWFEQMNELKQNVPEFFQEMILEILTHVEDLLRLENLLSESGLNIYSLALLSRKIDYYTGFIFEGYVEGVVTSPFRGGCYDCLVSEYSDGDISAAGFSLELSSVLEKI